MASTKKIETINDLPIYGSDSVRPKELWVSFENKEKTQLETLISTARQTACSMVTTLKGQTKELNKFVDANKKEADDKLSYLRSESTILPKVVFISLSTLSGFLIGFRRSTARKIFYSAVLGTATTALCYPNEAKKMSSLISGEASNQFNGLYRAYIWPENKPKKETVSKPQPAMENSKDKVIKLNKEELKSSSGSTVVGNKGMSNDDDQDMYTTRSK